MRQGSMDRSRPGRSSHKLPGQDLPSNFKGLRPGAARGQCALTEFILACACFFAWAAINKHCNGQTLVLHWRRAGRRFSHYTCSGQREGCTAGALTTTSTPRLVFLDVEKASVRTSSRSVHILTVDRRANRGRWMTRHRERPAFVHLRSPTDSQHPDCIVETDTKSTWEKRSSHSPKPRLGDRISEVFAG